VRSALRDLRQMSRGLYGVGCPYPGVECVMQQVNNLQAHCGCGSKSNLGLKTSASIKMLIVEMGISWQPFQELFLKYTHWIT
jgi:hypothetical protein